MPGSSYELLLRDAICSLPLVILRVAEQSRARVPRAPATFKFATLATREAQSHSAQACRFLVCFVWCVVWCGLVRCDEVRGEFCAIPFTLS